VGDEADVRNAGTLPLRDALLGLLIVAIWGTNFVVMRVGLEQLPPFLFATLRFAGTLLPAIFFLRRPAAWANLAAYGLFIGVIQFGLIYLALDGWISPGLTSLVAQTQVFFTIGLSIWLVGERVLPHQWAALGLATLGIGVIAVHLDASATPLGLAMILVAAFSWACGNIVSSRSRARNMVAYVVWASLFAAPPLFLLSLTLEGWPAIVSALAGADAFTWAAIVWQSVGNTLFGFAAWAWLLSRHPAALVTPMALLVPVFGMGAAALFLGEGMPAWKLIAAGLVIGGLAMNVFYPRFAGRQAAAPVEEATGLKP
jgi:O-acetylserine/cysteine efflux transporter